MDTAFGRDMETFPNLRSKLNRLLLHGETNQRDRLCAILHGLLCFAFLVLGAGVAIAIRDDAPRRKIGLLLVLPFLINAYIHARRCHVRMKRTRRLRRIIRRGVPVNAYVIQASPGLFKPGKETLPCLVIFSFQPEVADEKGYMSDLARRIYLLKGSESPDPSERIASLFTREENVVLDRRRPVPFALTDGSTIYCADLMVRQTLLPEKCLRGGVLPCFAEVGENGGIELVPAALFGRATERTLDTNTQVV